jgi:hypothetical protein
VSLEARPVDSDDYSEKTEPVVLVPKLVIELEGDREEFLAFAEPNQWALMQNAEAAKTSRKSGDTRAGMAAMYRLATTSVKPEDRDRFEDYMTEHGMADDLVDVLGTALSDLWAGETMLPLVPTSSDSSVSTGMSSSTSEGDSSPAGTVLAVVRTSEEEHRQTPEIEEQYGEFQETTGTTPVGSSSPDYR